MQESILFRKASNTRSIRANSKCYVKVLTSERASFGLERSFLNWWVKLGNVMARNPLSVRIMNYLWRRLVASFLLPVGVLWVSASAFGGSVVINEIMFHAAPAMPEN